MEECVLRGCLYFEVTLMNGAIINLKSCHIAKINTVTTGINSKISSSDKPGG